MGDYIAGLIGSFFPSKSAEEWLQKHPKLLVIVLVSMVLLIATIFIVRS